MSDEGHIHIYVPDLEQPNHGRCVCGRDGTPSSYDWWKTAIAQAAALAEARRRAEIAEVDTRQLEAVDAALPEWKGTGRGRIETISRLRDELAAARRDRDAAVALASERLDVSGLKDQDRLRLQAERDEARRALEDVLTRFSDAATLAAITPKGAESVRYCPMLKWRTPRVADVLRWRAALGRPAPDGEPR